ncbi:DUF2125 domain-containing protein [Kiloniella laminariae]|uniref:DUF2125 domain-containing protein n=1 Tax=Kiloniella laminariae TaxID=454162 RepID=A0ABT4LNV6_9PROT|nr:DUF2125 domain-containing protein [Kiloniella laminariae]MCZ4281637.1 DUF2125 domain-containing protein [Kiloniella laminariae]
MSVIPPETSSPLPPPPGSLAKRMFFAGIILCGFILLLAVAYWFWAAKQMETGLSHWVEKQQARGFEITHGTLALSGFPFVVKASLATPKIRSPEGWSWQTERLVAEAAPWSPLSMTLDLSQEHLINGLPYQEPAIRIQSNRATATARITLKGELLHARLQADDLFILREGHHSLEIASLDSTLGPLRPASGGATLQEFDITLNAQDVSHPELEKTPLKGPISQLQLQGTLYGDLPKAKLDKALHIWRDSGGFLSLHDASLRWGPLLVDARGKLALDIRLRPEGKLDSRIEGADGVVEQMEKSGLLNKGQSFGMRLSLAALGKNNSRGRHEINVPLLLQDGWLSLGPIALLPLPPLVQ